MGCITPNKCSAVLGSQKSRGIFEFMNPEIFLGFFQCYVTGAKKFTLVPRRHNKPERIMLKFNRVPIQFIVEE